MLLNVSYFFKQTLICARCQVTEISSRSKRLSSFSFFCDTDHKNKEIIFRWGFQKILDISRAWFWEFLLLEEPEKYGILRLKWKTSSNTWPPIGSRNCFWHLSNLFWVKIGHFGMVLRNVDDIIKRVTSGSIFLAYLGFEISMVDLIKVWNRIWG